VYVLDELRPINHVCSVEYLMDKIANEGRKFNIFGVFASQTWEAKMFKERGSSARDACVLKMAARMPKEQARILFKDKDAAHAVAHLETPEMYMSSIRYTGKLQVPFAAPADMEMLALEYMDARQQAQRVVNGTPPVEETIEETIEHREQGEATPVEKDDVLSKTRSFLGKKGVSLNAFAKAQKIDAGQLSRILNGKEKPSQQMIERLNAAISQETNIIQFPGGKNL
jgi:hypothetical protein